MYKSFFNIICCIFPLLLLGQEYNYVHYDTKDGLAGSTVYNITQDNEGFIWFATEFGVSRFDGKTFKNFTTDNGLTDNEVLKVCADKKGRVWIMPFNKSLFYYYKGKLFDAAKIFKLELNNRIENFCELENGSFLIGCNSKIYALKDYGKKEVIVNLDTLVKKYKSSFSETKIIGVFYKVVNGEKKLFIIINENEFEIIGNSLKFEKKIDKKYYELAVKNKLAIVSKDELRLFDFKNFNKSFSSMVELSNPKNYLISTIYDGCFFMDSTGNVDYNSRILLGNKISLIFVDKEKNIWFSSLGNGVYKLSSTAIKNFTRNGEVLSIIPTGDLMYTGTSSGTMFSVDKGQKVKKYNFNNFDNQGQDKRLFCMKSDNKNNLFLGFDSYLLKIKNNKTTYNSLRPIKSIDLYDEDNLIVSTNSYVFKIGISNMNIVDTLLYERGTKVVCNNSNVYVGTLKGVMLIDRNKKVKDLSIDAPILKRRITDMVKAKDGSLWVATNDTGILHINLKGKVDVQITTANQLSSNLCKALYLDNNYLWVGTNKGLNKIDVSNANYSIIKYSSSDGLPSDVINVIYAKDSIVYVGSPAGLTYFNLNSISHTSICNLVLENIIVSDKHLDSFNNIHLGHNDNNIFFNYTAVSFKSGEEIIYRYKLSPLDNEWKETKLNSLSYPSLPSGSYQLQLYAVNKFGKKSEVLTLLFDIATPFWKTIWFWIVVFITSLLLVGYLIRRRYLIIQETNNEKARIKQQLAMLEQSALQAQMNPHFIFNCLNSIQQFIMLNDKEKANKYLTEFANLIRNTFDNSGKKYIIVAEEAAYLYKYLDLEQLRYGDNFTFNINIDKSVEKDFTEMPAMLLQPYVENSLRHGIRNKLDRGGIIDVSFSQQNNILICSVSDNGVGREAALLLRSKEHIEYQSKGMLLTARRVELLNTSLENNITIEVKDLKSDSGKPLGTQVIISIPLYH